MRRYLFLTVAILTGGIMSAQAAPKQTATIETTKGTIVCELFTNDAPQTVANFVGLSHRHQRIQGSENRQSDQREILRRAGVPPR